MSLLFSDRARELASAYHINKLESDINKINEAVKAAASLGKFTIDYHCDAAAIDGLCHTLRRYGYSVASHTTYRNKTEEIIPYLTISW